MRYNGLDGWRAGLMMLGVLVHASAIYLDPAETSLYGAIILASRLFRMEAFVLIAGFFSELNQQKSDQHMSQRIWQLAVPFVTVLGLMGLLSVVPGAPSLASGASLDLNHLWFLPMLLFATLVSHALHRDVLMQRLDQAFVRSSLLQLSMIGLTCAAAAQLGTLTFEHLLEEAGLLSSGHTLVHVAIRLPYYLVYYLAGGLAARNRDRFVQAQGSFHLLIGPGLLLSSVAAYFVAFPWFLAGDKSIFQQILSNLLVPIVALPMCYTVIVSGLIACPLDRRVKAIAGSAFSVYLLHYGIVMLSGYWINQSALSTSVKFLIVVVLGLVVPFLLHVALISRVTWLRVLLNGAIPEGGLVAFERRYLVGAKLG